MDLGTLFASRLGHSLSNFTFTGTVTIIEVGMDYALQLAYDLEEIVFGLILSYYGCI